MNAKPDKNTLMAYLYDELDEAQQAQVEAYLSEHPEMAEELKALEDTRSILSNLDDVMPDVPTFELPEEKEVIMLPSQKNTIWQNPFIRNMVASAAMLSFLLLVGALTQLHISFQDGNFNLSFGQKPVQIKDEMPNANLASNPNISKDSVQILIKQVVDQDKNFLVTQLEKLNSKVEQIEQKPISSRTQTDLLSKEEIDQLMGEFREDNIKTMLKLVSLAREDQQKYTDEIVGVFAEYLELRREQDLQNIGKSLNNLQINQIKSQQETDRIIVKLIETVNLNHN